MTASEVIAEIDRLPPDEQQTVFIHVRMLEEEFTPDSLLQGTTEAERGENNRRHITAAQWVAERQALRPKLPGVIDDFIADRRQDRS